MSEVCNDVCIEPRVQPLLGEVFLAAGASARLDIATNGFWGGWIERAYFDVRIFNPHAPSNRQQILTSTNRTHEQAKVRAYEQRIREVKHGSFTPPPIMSLTGGAGPAATICFKRLASMLSEKRDQSYSSIPLPGCDASCHSPFCVPQFRVYLEPVPQLVVLPDMRYCLWTK